MKVVYLVESWFQERDYQRFGLGRLQVRGIEVEVWEVFLGKARLEYARTYRPPDPCVRIAPQRFLSGRALGEAVCRLERGNVVVLALLGDGWSNWPAFREIARAGIFFGTHTACFVRPELPGRRGAFWRKLMSMLRQHPRLWREIFYCRTPARWWGLRACSFILVNGGEDAAPEAQRLTSPDTDQVWSHALDYDLYLECRSRINVSANHIVFLDQYYPFHPDFISCGLSRSVTPGAYYPKLVRLFEALEQRLGLPVVVAAHPRSEYGRHPDFFRGRRVVRGETPKLIAGAQLVVTHESTAINFGVLFRKPILFVTTNDLMVLPDGGPYPQALSRLLRGQLVNLDEAYKLEQSSLLRVSLQEYLEYERRIIKRPGTPEKNTWEIFADYLQAKFCASYGNGERLTFKLAETRGSASVADRPQCRPPASVTQAL